MSESELYGPAILKTWLAESMDTGVKTTLHRVSMAEDVVRIAVMPDVHLAQDVCVGMAIATRRLVYPSAVGGDIGCGMLAIAFDAEAELARDPQRAGAILRALGKRIPTMRRHRARKLPLPDELLTSPLSEASLNALARGDGGNQLGTLGGGNHFIELQADEEERLWLMIHSGSRAMGQAIKELHLSRATIRSASMMALDTETDAGRAYMQDQDWARRFADANRRAMAREVSAIMSELFCVATIESVTISCDHNHVQSEPHFGERVLVHRKGAMPADAGTAGVVPGSMGTFSFHVEGRGCAEALRSSAHGAGRVFSRQAARERFGRADLREQMKGVWFDARIAGALREECPRAYKDIRAVLRAQGELVKVTRKLKPLLVYKAK